jgi:hypothetical protein
MGLSYTIAAGPRQRSHSRVRRFTVSDSRLSPRGGSGPCIYITEKQGGPVIPPGIGFFSSPPTTHRATVEVFHLASTREKFWRELIVYFPLIWGGSDEKLPAQNFFYCFMCISCSRNVLLPSNGKENRLEIAVDTQPDKIAYKRKIVVVYRFMY